MTGDIMNRLAALLGTFNRTDLMNQLQDMGLVSDNAVTLEDVPDSDAMKAFVKLKRATNKR